MKKAGLHELLASQPTLNLMSIQQLPPQVRYLDNRIPQDAKQFSTLPFSLVSLLEFVPLLDFKAQRWSQLKHNGHEQSIMSRGFNLEWGRICIRREEKAQNSDTWGTIFYSQTS